MKFESFLKKVSKLAVIETEALYSGTAKCTSIEVQLSRWRKAGKIIQLKRGLYVLRERWENAASKDFYALANRLQVPSYISLTTALSYHAITTQVQQGYLESVAITRTKDILVEKVRFRYFKLQERLYSGFIKKDGFFIATPEKALLDALYLSSIHRYRLDLDSLDLGRINLEHLRKLARIYPDRVKERVRRL